MIQDRVIKVFFSKGCVNILQEFRIAKYNLCLEDIMNFNTFCFFVFFFCFFVFQCGIRFEITFQFFFIRIKFDEYIFSSLRSLNRFAKGNSLNTV